MNCNTKKLVFATLAFAFVAVSLATPAEARRYKHKVMRGSAVHATHYVGAGKRHAWRAQRYKAPRLSRAARAAYAAVTPVSSMPTMGFGGGGLVTQARQYLGTNPTGMGALWCARFMNMVLEKSGRRGTGSNMANSFANYGTRVSGPQVGAIAVMSRGKRGGHVGIVSGVDSAGNPVVISGNYNRRVAETVIPRGRIYAYVMP
jgi:uncharacterized protein (TIGR02594 family)